MAYLSDDVLKEVRYSCTRCDQRFWTVYGLIIHGVTRHGKITADTPFDHLNIYDSRVHDTEPDYIMEIARASGVCRCLKCGKSYTRRDWARKHDDHRHLDNSFINEFG